MKEPIKINRSQLREKVVQTVSRICEGVELVNLIKEESANASKASCDQLAQEIFGMSFEEFYKNLRFFVGAADFEKLNQYRERLAQLESQRHVVESLVRRHLHEAFNAIGFEEMQEEPEEEYNPWINGDASWINGSYDIPYGFHVEIDTRHSTVAIDSKNGESYFLQGDEADDLIKQIAQYWSQNDCQQTDAVNAIISGMF